MNYHYNREYSLTQLFSYKKVFFFTKPLHVSTQSG